MDGIDSPILNLPARLDGLLRGNLPGGRPDRRLGDLFASILFFGILYGAVMGTYGGISSGRLLQVFYSGVKVPLLLLTTFALSLPSFWVLNMLLGLTEDFARVLWALVAAQATLTMVLASFAPLTAFWYVSAEDYHAAILFNAAMFGAASFASQMILRRAYRPLIARNPRHRWMRRLWLVIFAFVGIQMGWVLRPFLGDPTRPVQFFRADSWGNAYEEIAKMIWQLMTRHG